jgi:hypothetical protein
MNVDQYFQAFFDLLTEAKSVSNFSYRTAEKNHMSSSEFRDRICDLLSRLSDNDLKAVANKIKPTKYFNVVIQAHWAAVNLEAKKRGWECVI